MSTKTTIAYTEEFHLYEDFLQDNNIYLSQDFPNGSQITIEIPKYIWEYFRRFTAISFNFINKTEKELYAAAETSVKNKAKHPIWKNIIQNSTEEVLDTFEDFKKKKIEQINILKKIVALENKKNLCISENKTSSQSETNDKVLKDHIERSIIFSPIKLRHKNFKTEVKYNKEDKTFIGKVYSGLEIGEIDVDEYHKIEEAFSSVIGKNQNKITDNEVIRKLKDKVSELTLENFRLKNNTDVDSREKGV